MFFGDVFMLLVVIAVLGSPFLPILLKSKCPSCNKKKLEHLETVTPDLDGGKRTFITLYLCHNCNKQFQRVKSGPLLEIPVESQTQVEPLSA
jgi:hypothetical protein